MFFAGSERMITTKKHLTILKQACNDGVRFSVLHGEPSRTHSRSFGEFLLADSQTLGGPGDLRSMLVTASDMISLS